MCITILSLNLDWSAAVRVNSFLHESPAVKHIHSEPSLDQRRVVISESAPGMVYDKESLTLLTTVVGMAPFSKQAL
jgi:hypothetical protein